MHTPGPFPCPRWGADRREDQGSPGTSWKDAWLLAAGLMTALGPTEHGEASFCPTRRRASANTGFSEGLVSGVHHCGTSHLKARWQKTMAISVCSWSSWVRNLDRAQQGGLLSDSPRLGPRRGPSLSTRQVPTPTDPASCPQEIIPQEGVHTGARKSCKHTGCSRLRNTKRVLRGCL